ncbi:LPS export ABC transporter permease LptG [Herbaspirillum sp. RTI4]|uniref:LPS export ABC transporter permease LptG n=1 Tax=Herbaspirillum sp. RTI4 TaxID=3048640 RepID=UPI002AB4E1C8|nr:LPS export ABC transporter permease LptG [Herbaspirillum sp. RTI4]MDY7578158.1 LPS export ABC transporter permease LptG [Herbaspirillum sp. RTI4]MEA9980747.1 LPS export ABC transporter permease LptG [Herbaspirillum sp. RTI4]
MKVLQKYFVTEIVRSVSFALIAFMALFSFFDLIGELESVGRNGYTLQRALLYVVMGLPATAYDLMPIAVLIGTIYTLAQFAARSEFTIMRVSSLSTVQAAGMLVRIGVIFALLTILFGEFIAPKAAEWAERLKLQAQGSAVSQEFRSGLWAKDVIRTQGLTGDVIGSRFLNIRKMQPDGSLEGVKMYELDNDFHLAMTVTAKRGEYLGNHLWQLSEVTEAHFGNKPGDKQGDKPSDKSGSVQAKALDITAPISITTVATRTLVSEVTPEILSVVFANPDRMSAYDLRAYTKHLAANNQRTDRYEIAFWKKVVYPLSIFVMLALALPFAYMHFRAGGVSLKIFTGIMIGVMFQLINSLFSHLGLLNTWPPFLTAIVPSLLFLLLGLGTLRWAERH